MPPIYNYACVPRVDYSRNDGEKIDKTYTQGCDFSVANYGGPYMYVKMDDGSEEVLPHPVEESYAKKFTGKSVNQLMIEGKIYFKNAKICLQCLKKEMSEHNKDGCVCETPNFIDIPKLEGMLCPKCKEGKIRAVNVGIS